MTWTEVLCWSVWPHATEAFGYPMENKTYYCVRQPRLPSLAFPSPMSHTALAEPGARLTLAHEPPAANPPHRLLGPLLLCWRAATPRVLQAFLSGHRWLTHNGYGHQNRAVPPSSARQALWLLEAFALLKGTWPFASFCLVQSCLQELFPSIPRKRRQRRWDRSWQLGVAIIYPRSALVAQVCYLQFERPWVCTTDDMEKGQSCVSHFCIFPHWLSASSSISGAKVHRAVPQLTLRWADHFEVSIVHKSWWRESWVPMASGNVVAHQRSFISALISC